jgi:hypothetical protein
MRKLAQALFMAVLCFSATGVFASGTEEGEVVITGDENTSQPSLLLQNDEDTKPKE